MKKLLLILPLLVACGKSEKIETTKTVVIEVKNVDVPEDKILISRAQWLEMNEDLARYRDAAPEGLVEARSKELCEYHKTVADIEQSCWESAPMRDRSEHPTVNGEAAKALINCIMDAEEKAGLI